MVNNRNTLFIIKLSITFTVALCISTLNLSHAQTSHVKRAMDGDTIPLTNGEIVRLVGVDNPETKHPQKPVEHYAKEASAFTREMVEGKNFK